MLSIGIGLFVAVQFAAHSLRRPLDLRHTDNGNIFELFVQQLLDFVHLIHRDFNVVLLAELDGRTHGVVHVFTKQRHEDLRVGWIHEMLPCFLLSFVPIIHQMRATRQLLNALRDILRDAQVVVEALERLHHEIHAFLQMLGFLNHVVDKLVVFRSRHIEELLLIGNHKRLLLLRSLKRGQLRTQIVFLLQQLEDAVNIGIVAAELFEPRSHHFRHPPSSVLRPVCH
mmetsp:Transcript_7652/g.12533  ORF Transcript_7652/g.12533 Transcript_7652/m.12533 type:complete len:227 (-) Transcript_7652:445-1125(-)